MVSSKYAFLGALAFTIIVFVFGLLFGFFIEDTRSKSLEENLWKSEISLLDEQTRENLFGVFDVRCNITESNLFSFADRIYEESKKLEKYDSISKFSDSLRVVHKRYDLLRVMLWTEAIELKKTCKSNFHTVVYFFDYGNADIETSAKQLTYSKLLAELKSKYGNSVLLIPIAANLNLSSVDIIMSSYNVSSRPFILIDENISFSGLPTFSELENSISKHNK